MGVVFVILFTAYLVASGFRAVRHDLAGGHVGRARYAVLVRGHAITGIALAPATTLLYDSPILPAMAMFWFAWVPSILDPHWRRIDAPPLTADAKIVSARTAHPATQKPKPRTPGRTPARQPSRSATQES